MEKGIDSYLKEQFEIPDVDIRTYSPLTLAYIGDGIYDLVIRSLVVAKGNTRASELHKRTSQIVKAHTQAERRRQPCIREGATPNLLPWQKMPQCRITVRQPDLKHSWDICI